jgi:hypothetical protein
VRPWWLALLLVGSVIILVDFWWLLNGAPAPHYKGQLLALIGGNTRLAAGIAVLGPICLVAGAYGLWALVPSAPDRLTLALGTTIVVFVVLFPVAILSRPPLARYNLSGGSFTVLGGFRHSQNTGQVDMWFSDDLRSAFIKTPHCGDWEARLAVTPTGDSMALIDLRRPTGDSCVHPATLRLIHDLGTVRSWTMEWFRDDIVDLHGESRTFQLLE